MENNNREFKYHNVVFGKFLESLFQDKDDEDEVENKNNGVSRPPLNKDEEDEAPLFI